MRSFAHKMIHFVPTKRLDFLVEYKQKKAQGGNTVDYGKNLARLRINANMSQEELASHLFVPRDLVSKWENNKRRPGYDALQKMASLFSVEPESIIPVEKKLADELSIIYSGNRAGVMNGNVYIDYVFREESDSYAFTYQTVPDKDDKSYVIQVRIDKRDGDYFARLEKVKEQKTGTDSAN